jgi:hypothetical protein
MKTLFILTLLLTIFLGSSPATADPMKAPTTVQPATATRLSLSTEFLCSLGQLAAAAELPTLNPAPKLAAFGDPCGSCSFSQCQGKLVGDPCLLSGKEGLCLGTSTICSDQHKSCNCKICKDSCSASPFSQE